MWGNNRASVVAGICGLIAIATIAVLCFDVTAASTTTGLLHLTVASAAGAALDVEGIANEVKTAVTEMTKSTSEMLGKLTSDLAAERKSREDLERKLNCVMLSGSGGDDAPAAAGAEHKAIAAFARTGSDVELKSATGMSVGSDPAGGYLVFPVLSQTMTKKIYELSPIRRLARVEPIGAGDGWVEPIDNQEVGATWVGEKESRQKTDTAQFGELNVPVNEIMALQPITQRLLDDASIDIGKWIEGKISDKFGRAEGQACVTGDGVRKPKGYLSYPTTTASDGTRPWGTLQHVAAGVSSSSAFVALGAAAGDKLKDLMWSLRTPYRKDAVWSMNSNTAAVLDKLKDGQGNYIWSTAMTAGAQSSLLGYPVELDEGMPDIAANSLSISFGNFKLGYLIVDKPGIRMLRDPYTDKPNVLFYAYRRVGGGVAHFEAIKLMKFA